uniref:Uncharacterized protein n=1 Tax=Oryza punctata TaxID=4537 RepID=A0A0E0MKM2_ORYPU
MSNNHVPIMSIIDHGGIGKTILAQLMSLAYRIKEHFETVIWVSASTFFYAEKLISKIIQTVTLSKPSVDTCEATVHCKSIWQGHFRPVNIYLLILDDVREDKEISEWENCLDPKEFEDIREAGEKIAKKLRVTSTRHLAHKFASDIVAYSHKIMNSKKKNWCKYGYIASGLIPQTTGEVKRAQDFGEEYLIQLTRKSFFDLNLRNFRFGRNEGHEYYVMHDLIHDLATWVSSGGCARIADVNGSERVKRTLHHPSVVAVKSFPVEVIKSFCHFKYLRTFIFEDCHDIQDDAVRAVEEVVESLKALRVVQSKLISRCQFPGKFANLKHLHYVVVSLN